MITQKLVLLLFSIKSIEEELIILRYIVMYSNICY